MCFCIKETAYHDLLNSIVVYIKLYIHVKIHIQVNKHSFKLTKSVKPLKYLLEAIISFSGPLNHSNNTLTKFVLHTPNERH
jgi:hypothetical protein